MNNALFNNNLAIEDKIIGLKEVYKKMLENQINKFFTEESIEEKINNLYENEIKDINYEMEKSLTENIKVILNKIKESIIKEANRLKSEAVSYNNDYSKINNTISEYKKTIFNNINITIFNIFYNFHQNIINNVYNDYIEKGLNDYIIEAKKYTSNYKEYKLLNISYKIGDIINNLINELIKEYKDIALEEINYQYIRKSYSIFNFDKIKKIIDDEIDNNYKENLFKSLNEIAIYNRDIYGYNEYDFNDDIKNDINSLIESKMNNISNIVNKIKGNNYNVNISDWLKMNYKSIESEILSNITINFENFIINENNGKMESFQKIITINFNKSLNFFIENMGRLFFERIIKYNEIIKVIELFNYIKYSLNQSFLYYNYLIELEDLDFIPFDLRNRLSIINNLDIFIENKNKEILNVYEAKINEFINQTRDYIIKYYFSKYNSINAFFDYKIIEIINNNLRDSILYFEFEYSKLLNIELKEKLLNSFEKLLKSQTDEIKKTINFQKGIIESKINDIKIVEYKEITNNLNIKINNTLNSIEAYNNHFKRFKISEELINYLNSFGNNIIKPSFKGILSKLSRLTKDIVVENIETNIKKFENCYKPHHYINIINSTYSFFELNYFGKIDEYLNNFELNVYPKNLEREMLIFEEKIFEISEINENFNDIFIKLITISENNTLFINNLNQLKEFDEIVKKYICKINYSFEESNQIIFENNYEKEINDSLYDNLFHLRNISLEYYEKIKDNYMNLKQYINESIIYIDQIISRCYNLTLDSFINIYNKIYNETEKINFEYSKIDEKLNPIYYEFTPEDTLYTIKTDIKYF